MSSNIVENSSTLSIDLDAIDIEYKSLYDKINDLLVITKNKLKILEAERTTQLEIAQKTEEEINNLQKDNKALSASLFEIQKRRSQDSFIKTALDRKRYGFLIQNENSPKEEMEDNVALKKYMELNENLTQNQEAFMKMKQKYDEELNGNREKKRSLRLGRK